MSYVLANSVGLEIGGLVTRQGACSSDLVQAQEGEKRSKNPDETDREVVLPQN